MSKATIIMSSGLEKPLNHRPSLKEAQDIVGGCVELYRVKGTKLTLVFNEDGRRLNLPANEKASYYFAPPITPNKFVGNVIVLEGWRTVGN